MKQHNKPSPKALEMNTQFVRAFLWLQANTSISNQYELAELLETSPSTVSELINHKKALTREYAGRMNEVLEKHGFTLKDFAKDYINKQAGLASKKSKQEAYESLLLTRIIRLEGGMEATLEKLSILEKNMGELLKLGELLKKQQTK